MERAKVRKCQVTERLRWRQGQTAMPKDDVPKLMQDDLLLVGRRCPALVVDEVPAVRLDPHPWQTASEGEAIALDGAATTGGDLGNERVEVEGHR